MKNQTVTIEKIKSLHADRRDEIRSRLAEFREVWDRADDERIWEEMVFCIFTAGCSAKMGLRSIEAVRSLLGGGEQHEIAKALVGKHRYPNARARYVAVTRDHLRAACGMRLRAQLSSFRDSHERRDWLVSEKSIKGLGYKEASHFLRNIGFSGYAILDKHVLNCLADLKIIAEPKPPNTRSKYLSHEALLAKFAADLKIDLDEMDLVLWSLKTGEILK